MKLLNKKVHLEEYIPQYENQAIHFTGDDMGSDDSVDGQNASIYHDCDYRICICGHYDQYNPERSQCDWDITCIWLYKKN